MLHLARTTAIFAAALAALALACVDSESPVSTTRSTKHPLIGVFDVTTALDSISFETSAIDDCSAFQSCVVVRPSSGGLLRGTLIIGDSVVVIDTVYPGVGLPPRPIRDTLIYQLPLVTGTFVGQACAVIDFQHGGGCLTFADTLRSDYTRSSGPITTGSFAGTQRQFVVTLRSTSPNPQRTLTLTASRDAGDTIWGRLMWQTNDVQRTPPRLYGGFRAVQRR